MIFAVTTLFFYAVMPQNSELNWSLFSVAIISGAYFLFAERKLVRVFITSRSTVYGLNSSVLVIIVLCTLIFVNLLAYRHKHRFDFTEQSLYSLAPQTLKIISNLPREVKITGFFVPDSGNKLIVQNLLDGYLEKTDKIEMTYINPDKNPAIVKRYGVTLDGTIVLESGEQETKVNTVNEESLTNALIKVTRDVKKKLYFLSGHGEKVLDNNQKPGISAAKAALERDGYQVKNLLLLQTAKIPDDTNLLVIAGPVKPVLDKETDIIEEYLNRGGSVMILVDPLSKFDMETLLLKWGVQLKDDIIIDPMSKLYGGDFQEPIVSQYTPHDITRDFALATIFPMVRSVHAMRKEGIVTTQLLQTGQNSWGETDFDSPQVKFDQGIDQQGPIPVAVIATREISTDASSSNESDDPESLESKPEAVKKGKLMVVGDSDFVANGKFNFSGNSDFFLNSVSWLAEESDLISIRAKQRGNQPFHMSSTWGSTLFIFGMILLPGSIIFAGIRTWWRRRRL
jgi:ABC-type uncharacterized transport system involved in gliding motility auxiliary subunit